MPLEDDLVELVDANSSTVGRLQEGAVSALSRPLSDFQGWYDHSAIRTLSELLAGLLRGFETVAARQADSYMAQAVSIVTGKRFQPVGARNTQLGRTGVDNASVIGRIANAFRYQQAEVDRAVIQARSSGDFLNLPVPPRDAAYARLDKIVGTNLQMAARSQAQTTLAASTGVTGYRRIIHPELAGEEGTCGLCVAAADRHYKRGELLPIHPGCHCTVLPTTKRFDPHSINEADLGRVYADAGSTSAADLRATRYKIDQHGEIGPVIRPEGQPIRKRKQVQPTHKPVADQMALIRNKRDKIRESLARLDDTDDGTMGDVRARVVERLGQLDSTLTELEAAA